ncbi:hypothetical protein [Pseudomonas nitroreducens]|uniref:hypothetical protein n=1 Tax=Pseudomonas nitroreducens TaxID=46680 RepID=UPI00351CE6F3
MEKETLNMVTLILSSVSTLAAAGSAIFAYMTIRTSTRNLKKEMEANDEVRKSELATRENERLLAHAYTTMERAYSALMGSDPDAVRPPADRVAWLTAARLIVEYQGTKPRITDQLLLQECESHENHWRHQFYLKLGGIQSSGYYDANDRPIEPISAIVIHGFADWPSGKSDPLDTYDSKTDAIQKIGVSNWWLPLRVFLGLV